MEPVIKVEHLTKDYGNKKGIFDLSFEVNKGETFGFVGTNGSGKTTTIRHIMGFLKPMSGKVTVNGLDSWENSCEIKRDLSYVPGEIAFPDLSNGTTFLKAQAELLHVTDMTYANYVIEKLQLDPTANLKRMSKGMKQKTAIVAALMGNKDVIILDEPTTGLDPLMRETFLSLVLEQKAMGKTILMSSQSFDELELTCDKVALIYNGRIIDVIDIHELKSCPYKIFKIEFTNEDDYKKFKTLNFEIIRDQEKYNQVTIKIDDKDINDLFSKIKDFHLKFISEIKNSLEKHCKELLANETEAYVYKEEEKISKFQKIKTKMLKKHKNKNKEEKKDVQ